MDRLSKLINHLSPTDNNSILNNNNLNMSGQTYCIFLCDKRYFFGDLILQLMKNEKRYPNEKWVVFNVYKNEFPTVAEMQSFSGVVISGSAFDAYDTKTAWIVKLRKLISETYERENNAAFHSSKKTKWLGLCFGHQILAHTLGGKCGPSNRIAYDVGVNAITLTPEFDKYFANYSLPFNMKARIGHSLKVCKSHRDAILQLPTNAILLAHSPVTDVEMFAIGDCILGIQGHPEFDATVIAGICEKGKSAGKLTAEEYDNAYESMKENVPQNDILQELFQQWIRK